MLSCRIHGFAPTCAYSPTLLVLREDGTLPDIVIVEIKDCAEEEAFFRFNVSAEEAALLPIKNGCIPFDLDATDILDRLPKMCGHCFGKLRDKLLSQKRDDS